MLNKRRLEARRTALRVLAWSFLACQHPPQVYFAFYVLTSAEMKKASIITLFTLTLYYSMESLLYF